MPETDAIPVSASVAGPGLGIRYIGKHCYAYNLLQQTTSADAYLDFTSGSGYIVADLVLCASVKMAAGSDGGIVVWELKLNDQGIAMFKTDSIEEDMPANFVTKILIPPLTHFVLNAASNYSTSGFFISAQLIGRVYGAE
jgi:hypothetical protein